MPPILSASMMCADYGNLSLEVQECDTAGVDVFHIDIMDGDFVPNFALSLQDFATVRSSTRSRVDVHLMVRNPSAYLPFVYQNKADIIYVHFEVGDSYRHLNEIREHGAEAGLAINPSTSISEFEHLLPFVDRLLVMRVHPGFKGQKPLDAVEGKLEELVETKNGFIIGIDGAVSADVVRYWYSKGVDEFILGTSALFGKGQPYSTLIHDLRASAYRNPHASGLPIVTVRSMYANGRPSRLIEAQFIAGSIANKLILGLNLEAPAQHATPVAKRPVSRR